MTIQVPLDPATPAEAPTALPLIDGPAPPLRADALRNRTRVLTAAARVIERVGANGLTMEAVAAEAGVGKGTVFRRFGDRSSLLHALIDEEECKLQDAVIHGPAPLGPGAPPLERLIAFGEARLEHAARNGAILAAAEMRPSASPDAETHPVTVAMRVHIAHLLRLGGLDTELAGVLSSALLAFLSGCQPHTLLTVEGHDPSTLREAWGVLARGALAGVAPQRT